MEMRIGEIDNHVDDHVDEEIKKCFDVGDSKSFFTFAGAGSGKTRSLIKALTFLDQKIGHDLLAYSKQVAVITYTNAACDEISRRIQYKSIFAVSTIHSFLWELIKNYQTDIKDWVHVKILTDIVDLEDQQSRGRAGTDAYKKRAENIINKKERLSKLNKIKRFSYNPNGENFGYDSLNHDEVINIGSDFIASKATMQKILVSKYPILLIDESQDTKKCLIDALLLLHQNHKSDFVIGMFGDTMQKIYTDGKDNLVGCIPEDWEKPTKIMNHRSATRIVKLANAIRRSIDEQKQQARSDAEDGTIRLFIANSSSDKTSVEKNVAEMMAEESGDNEWLNPDKYKSLILEHHMAASRFGFAELYGPLNEIDSFSTSLRDGSLPELSFFANIILPLVNAYNEKRDFEVAKIVRKHSPILDKKSFEENCENQSGLIRTAEKAVNALLTLWDEGNLPSCIDILNSIKKSGLFKISDRMEDILANSEQETSNDKVIALRKALNFPYTQLVRYASYVSGSTQFATHQGIKGLEFPRVVVIMDDEESRGFLFNYDKLFGVKEKTETDKRNEREGKDTSIARTTRLFYVACTRAQKSLAVIAYTSNTESVRKTAIENGWFTKEEIQLVRL